jgi:5'-nucleotidase
MSGSDVTVVGQHTPAKLVIAISSRALFDLDESHRVYEEEGIEAYCHYQVEREDEPLAVGQAFPLVRKLLNINSLLQDKATIEIVLLSRNSADTGLRVFNSINHHKLQIRRAAFTGGERPFPYAKALGAHLFLSANAEDVRLALDSGLAAATIFLDKKTDEKGSDRPEDEQLRIAFDGDAVLFSDEAERVYQNEGLEAFEKSEKESARLPLPGGPFKQFLAVLHQIQKELPAEKSPIRTALITARGAPAHERVIRTLRSWGVRIDEALFLGGIDKSDFLKAFRADIFFDDRHQHCQSASRHVPSAHVPHGVANEE